MRLLLCSMYPLVYVLIHHANATQRPRIAWDEQALPALSPTRSVPSSTVPVAAIPHPFILNTASTANLGGFRGCRPFLPPLASLTLFASVEALPSPSLPPLGGLIDFFYYAEVLHPD